MKLKLLLTTTVVSLLAFACANSDPKTETKPTTDTTKVQADMPPTIDAKIVDNMKDPSCGMPVAAGISDSTTFKGKIYGFCSKECKDAFLKNPTQYIAAAELKK